MAQSSSSSEVPQARARYVQAAAASAGVQFDEEMRWLCRVREALEHASAESLGAFPKVFDVPRALRDTKPDAYAPQHFALGPYHRSRPDLKDMERYKLAAAKRAERLFAGDHKIPDLVYRFLTLQGEIRGPYHRILELSNETLAWMMAVDTCFLLDFLLGRYLPATGRGGHGRGGVLGDQLDPRHAARRHDAREPAPARALRPEPGAPLRLRAGRRRRAARRPRPLHQGRVPHQDLCLHGRPRLHQASAPARAPLPLPCPAHGRLRRQQRPGYSTTSPGARPGRRWRRPGEADPGGVRQGEAATLSLPVIVLDSNTEVVLRNLMAYEAVAARGPLVLARYTELMNGIVDTAKDVKILQQSGVVVNRMKNKAEAASMWNGMCRATRVSRVTRLDAVIKAVNEHRDKTASARAQKLLKKYVFGSWKILTLLASVSLLLMTALQTFCSTYPCQSTWFRHMLPSS